MISIREERITIRKRKMSCYFVIDTYIDEIRGRGMYDDYIEKVKPIVEKYGEHIWSGRKK